MNEVRPNVGEDVGPGPPGMIFFMTDLGGRMPARWGMAAQACPVQRLMRNEQGSLRP